MTAHASCQRGQLDVVAAEPATARPLLPTQPLLPIGLGLVPDQCGEPSDEPSDRPAGPK
jgi:hypothetical protein